MSKFIFVNSFDRSGSSMLAKIASRHPDVECLFQPLNSSVIRRFMFDYWEGDKVNAEAVELMENIFQGNWSKDVIKSHWFFTHSTTDKLEHGKTYLIKTTNAHFKFKWLSKNFPDLKLVALIRDPRDILASLERNKLGDQWYSEEMMEECFDGFSSISAEHKRIANSLRNISGAVKILKMAAVIAMMNYVMLEDAPEGNVIRYEHILKDPNKEIYNTLLTEVDPDFDFSKFLDLDYNIIGKPPGTGLKLKEMLSKSEYTAVNQIFAEVEFVGYDR